MRIYIYIYILCDSFLIDNRLLFTMADGSLAGEVSLRLQPANGWKLKLTKPVMAGGAFDGLLFSLDGNGFNKGRSHSVAADPTQNDVESIFGSVSIRRHEYSFWWLWSRAIEENGQLLLLLFLLLSGRCEWILEDVKESAPAKSKMAKISARAKKISCKKYWGKEEITMGWAVGVRIIAWCLYLR